MFFVDHDAQTVQLSDRDLPALVMLGDVNIAEKQHLVDAFHGGFAAICTSRLQEVC